MTWHQNTAPHSIVFRAMKYSCGVGNHFSVTNKDKVNSDEPRPLIKHEQVTSKNGRRPSTPGQPAAPGQLVIELNVATATINAIFICIHVPMATTNRTARDL